MKMSRASVWPCGVQCKVLVTRQMPKHRKLQPERMSDQDTGISEFVSDHRER